MENNSEVHKILEDHEKRIANLETILANKPKTLLAVKDKKSLSDHIIELRDTGFFTQPKIPDETHNKLQENYHCERNRVDVALLRLAGRGQLRKTTKIIDDKKYKAYVW